MINNCANLILTDNSNNCTYKISSIDYQEKPLENLPPNTTLMNWVDFNFCLIIDQYSIVNPNQTQAVIGQDGKPLYLIGEFIDTNPKPQEEKIVNEL